MQILISASNKKNTRFIKNKSAFSLIELSIVILIIGIIISGVTQSSRLVAAYRLQSAQTITQSSPVPSIKGLVFWLESTSTASFDDSEAEDGYAVSTWKDINPTSSTKHNATATSTARPTYQKDCINNLPCLVFDGTNDVLTNDELIASIGEFTIFIVMDLNQSDYSGSYAYYFTTNYTSVANGRIMFLINSGADSSCYVNYDDPDNAIRTANRDLDNYSRPFLVKCYEQDNVKLSYNVNRSEATATNVISGGKKNILGYTLGNFKDNGSYGPGSYFNGKIAEVIFYDRYLKSDERQAVENYLAKKWRVALN